MQSSTFEQCYIQNIRFAKSRRQLATTTKLKSLISQIYPATERLNPDRSIQLLTFHLTMDFSLTTLVESVVACYGVALLYLTVLKWSSIISFVVEPRDHTGSNYTFSTTCLFFQSPFDKSFWLAHILLTMAVAVASFVPYLTFYIAQAAVATILIVDPI